MTVDQVMLPIVLFDVHSLVVGFCTRKKWALWHLKCKLLVAFYELVGEMIYMFNVAGPSERLIDCEFVTFVLFMFDFFKWIYTVGVCHVLSLNLMWLDLLHDLLIVTFVLVTLISFKWIYCRFLSCFLPKLNFSFVCL